MSPKSFLVSVNLTEFQTHQKFEIVVNWTHQCILTHHLLLEMFPSKLPANLNVFGKCQSKVYTVGRYSEFSSIVTLRLFLLFILLNFSWLFSNIDLDLCSLRYLISFVGVVQSPIHGVVYIFILLAHLAPQSILYIQFFLFNFQLSHQFFQFLVQLMDMLPLPILLVNFIFFYSMLLTPLEMFPLLLPFLKLIVAAMLLE